VVSNAGWPDARNMSCRVADLAEAAVSHAGQPTVVTVGAGAGPVAPADEAQSPSN
jgi:uroporphyrin-III C-methyltransferase